MAYFERHRGLGWLRASAVVCLLSACAVGLDMTLRVYVPSYTERGLDRMPYIGRGCLREWCFSDELAWMNAKLAFGLAIIFIIIMAIAAGAVIFLRRFPVLPVIAASIYDLFGFFVIVFVFLPLIGPATWSGPAVFDAGFGGGILAVICAAYGVSVLALGKPPPAE